MQQQKDAAEDLNRINKNVLLHRTRRRHAIEWTTTRSWRKEGASALITDGDDDAAS
jgi:hypothetical protein